MVYKSFGLLNPFRSKTLLIRFLLFFFVISKLLAYVLTDLFLIIFYLKENFENSLCSFFERWSYRLLKTTKCLKVNFFCSQRKQL